MKRNNKNCSVDINAFWKLMKFWLQLILNKYTKKDPRRKKEDYACASWLKPVYLSVEIKVKQFSSLAYFSMFSLQKFESQSFKTIGTVLIVIGIAL